MNIKIITDTGADLNQEEQELNNVSIVEMPVRFDKDLEDTNDIDEFWKKLIEGKVARTSQPSPMKFQEEFLKAKNEKYAVICILISSKLSGTYQTAVNIKEEIGYEEIYIIDSKLATIAEKVLVLKACELRKQNKSAQEIFNTLNKFKYKIKLLACIDTLQYLARGGRISKTTANIGNLINLKPIITLHDGEVHVITKCFGNTRAIGKIIDIFHNDNYDDNYSIHPIYAYNEQNCLALLTKLAHKKIKLVLEKISPIGSTIGTHIGPGGYGIIYICK